VANIEFEMIGAQDPKLPPGWLLLTGWDHSSLGRALLAHGAKIVPDPYPEMRLCERSDSYFFASKGIAAHTVVGWPAPYFYHQPNDDIAHLDVAFLISVIQSMIEPIRWLANSNFIPK